MPLTDSFQFSTLDFNSRRARTLLDPYPDSDSDDFELEGPPTNPCNSGIFRPRAPDDSRAQEVPPPPPSVLDLTTQEPPSVQAVTATGTNIHSHLLPTPPSAHVRPQRPQVSASALSYRSRTGAKRRAKSPHRHVSFSFDGRPPMLPSPQFLTSSSALSPSLPLAAPDSDPPRLPQAPPLETSTPVAPAKILTNRATRVGSRFWRGDEHSNPFIDVINDAQGRNICGDEEDDEEDDDDEDDDEEDELDNSHTDHPNFSLPPLPLPSSSRRSRTPTTTPRETPQPTGPPLISSAIKENVIGLRAPARPMSTSRSVIFCDTNEQMSFVLTSWLLTTFLTVVWSPAPILYRNRFLQSLWLLALAAFARPGMHFS